MRRVLVPLMLLLVGSLVLGVYREQTGQRVIDAAWKNDSRAVEMLLGRGANPNVCRTRKDNFRSEVFCWLGSAPGHGTRHLGWTPLMIAAMEPAGNVEMVTALLRHGAEVNATGWLTATPLTCAAEAGNVEIAKLLLQHDAGVNQAGKLGHTALMHAAGAMPGSAARQESPEPSRALSMVHLLMEAGAEVDMQNHRGQTALMFAAAASRRDIVAALLSNGAKANTRDRDGRTAREYARDAADRSIVTLLGG